MTKSLTSMLRISPAILSVVLLASPAWADPLMSKAQYSDYSVSYQCAEINFHNDLAKKEEVLIQIEEKFGLNDDNFDAFDELITEYERDDSLLDNVRARVSTECQLASR